MEDLIYILLGLVWLFFAFYRQSQKKKKKLLPPEADPGKEEKGPLSFFEEMLTGNDEDAVVPSYPVDEANMDYADVRAPSGDDFQESSFEDEYGDLGITSVEGQEDISQVAMSMSDGIIQDDIYAYDIEKDDVREGLNIDFRQAVIYSEILNRPEF